MAASAKSGMDKTKATVQEKVYFLYLLSLFLVSCKEFDERFDVELIWCRWRK